MYLCTYFNKILLELCVESLSFSGSFVVLLDINKCAEEDTKQQSINYKVYFVSF